MRTPVSASGEQTSLSDRKRRAGQRLALLLPTPVLGSDQRALLRELGPAGFAIDPRGAEDPAQLRELAAELTAALPPARPPLILARHPVGRAGPGTTEQPPLRWLAQADDPALTRDAGWAWRRELGVLGFHLHLGPACDPYPLGGEPLPALDVPFEPLLAGPDAGRAARTLGAFVAAETGAACAACPSLCQGWLREERLVTHEQELPGLEAEELRVVEAVIRAGVPALVVGHGRWAAFSEELPCACVDALLHGQLRQRLGFAGLLLAEDPAVLPALTGQSLGGILWYSLRAGLDQWLIGGPPERQVAVFEALVKLQEERVDLDTPLKTSDKRLLATRERLLRGRRPVEPAVLDSPAHRDLVLMARVRGGS